MHATCDISDDDMRYVLATFVVVPQRWIRDFGFREMTPHEITASTRYYLELGRLMNIRDLPATLDLMATFRPNSWAPRFVVRRFAFSLTDEPLLRAFRYPVPGRLERGVFRGAMRVRARLLRLFPARSEPRWVSAYGCFRSYPAGYDIDHLGTFPGGGGCPFHAPTEPGEAVS